MKRKALGRGLNSLIPGAPPRAVPPKSVAAGPVQQLIDLDRISPNRRQPRSSFDDDSLNELAESMRRQGVLQPVVVRVREADGGFELVAGERRWRAAQIAGLLKIPAVVRDVADDQLLELALIENLQREDLNPSASRRSPSGSGSDGRRSPTPCGCSTCRPRSRSRSGWAS